MQENNVPAMEYVRCTTLAVPDALSRRPDYMRYIPSARVVGLEARDGATAPARAAPPLHEAIIKHSTPPKVVVLPAALTGTPAARTTEEAFPMDNAKSRWITKYLSHFQDSQS